MTSSMRIRQITQWLLPRVPGSDARRIVNPLSVLSQWKIFDNLRRSLVPIALLLFLLGSWLLAPELDGGGLLLVVGIIAIPGDRKSTRLNSSHLGISYAVLF